MIGLHILMTTSYGFKNDGWSDGNHWAGGFVEMSLQNSPGKLMWREPSCGQNPLHQMQRSDEIVPSYIDLVMPRTRQL